MTLVKRLVKGSAITAAEHDGNMDHVLDMANMTEAAAAKVLTADERTKLTNIEALADVTDATNVEAAGALMDSEVTNLAAVKAFDPTAYATAAQGSAADTALQPGDAVTTLDGTAHRVLYVSGSGDVTELALGADGTFLKSNGAAVAPSFATPAGSGDVSKVGTPLDNQVGVWTGDGTIEGTAGLTYDGSVLAVAGTVDGRNTFVATDIKTGAYTAATGDLVMTNTATIGAFTVTLPPTPAAGDQVAVLDVPNNWATANVTLARNGSNIDSAASDLPLNGGIYVLAIYTGDAAIGWRIF